MSNSALIAYLPLFKSQIAKQRQSTEGEADIEETTVAEETSFSPNVAKEKAETETAAPEESKPNEPASESNEPEQEKTTEADASSSEPVDAADSGTIDHLIVVANDPDASTTMDDGVTYMFTKDDSGNRVMGNVMAYYKDVSGLDTTDLASYCRSYAENYIPEIMPYYDTAETHDEGGYFGVVVSTNKCKVTLMPDKDYGGITVIISVVL